MIIDAVALGCWVGNGCWESELAGWAAGERQATPERLFEALELNALKWVERITLFMPCVFKGRIKHYLSLTR